MMMSPHADDAKRCDLCEQTQFETVAAVDRRGRPLETVVCRTCGLVCHGRIPTERELADFYRDEYREQYHGERTPSARRVMRAWRNGERIYRQLQDYVVPGDEVFEVGAGIGCTVKQFELRRCAAAGIEPHEGFQQFATRELRTRVAQASLFDLPPTPRHDILLLVHVIEHFQSPRAALQHLHSILRPGGLLYVECPNLGAPFAMRDKLFHYAHIHNFTQRTLEMMAERAGFVMERSFKRPEDQALELLFRKAGAVTPDYAGSYEETMAALSRYNWASYHLRRRYWWPRLQKLAGYGLEYLAAKPFVARRLRECRAADAPPSVRRAA